MRRYFTLYTEVLNSSDHTAHGLTLGGPEIGHSVHTLEFPLLIALEFPVLVMLFFSIMAETLDFHAQSNGHISMNNSMGKRKWLVSVTNSSFFTPQSNLDVENRRGSKF